MKKKRKKLILITSLLTFCLLLSACGTRQNAASQSTGGEATAAADEAQSSAAGYDDGIDYSRALAKNNQEFSAEDAELTLTEENPVAKALPAGNKDYTIMVYMVGSNLESKLGNASKDLAEMEEAGINFDATNLLVYTGGARRWTSDVPSDRNALLDMSVQGEDRMVAHTASNADMGASATLKEFVNFCTNHYPADHYALIFWDHGGGPLWGFGSDELFDSDSLTISEMKEAMEGTVFFSRAGEQSSKTKKLDFVGFDACLMGSIENMNMWSRFANYYVGSEELEPGDGWDYHFMSVLNESLDPLVITGAIVDSYGAYYEKLASDTYNPDVTLACADLSVIGKVSEEIGKLSTHLTSELDSGRYGDIQRTMNDVKNCGVIENSKGGSSYSYDLIDLGSFAQSLKEDAQISTSSLSDAVDTLIVKQYSNVEGTSGVTMYYPHINKGQYSKMQDAYAGLAVSREYSSYLSGISARWMTSSSRDWKLGTPEKADDQSETFTYQLTDEQMESTAAAYYTVLADCGDGTYYSVMGNQKLEISRDGKIEIPANPKVLCLMSDTGEATVWPFNQLESKKSRDVYKTGNARLGNHVFLEYDIESMLYQSVDVVLSVMKDTGEIKLQTVNAAENETVGSSGKNTVDTSGWEQIYYTYHALNPGRNKEGALLPCSEWGSDEGFSIVLVPIDSNFSFEAKPVSETQKEYSVQFVLEDVSGERYASELMPLPKETNSHKVTQKTAQGTITYDVYEDHAEVAEYIGGDTELEVSGKVDGVPVTIIQSEAFSKVIIGSVNGHNTFRKVILPDSIEEIGSSAFKFCSDMEEIQLPSSLKSIGDCAFAECKSLKQVQFSNHLTKIGKGAFAYCFALESVDLPSSLETIGEGAFLGCENLLSISMPEIQGEDGEHFHVVDQLLLSKDQKTVLASACGKAGTVRIPDGVTTIAYGAFCRSSLENVVFPEGLTEIDNFAFYMTKSLQPPVFPSSLERIGSYAFGTSDMGIGEEQMQSDRQEIQIGANVTKIEQGAFDEFPARWFTVSEDNPGYSSVNGAICNKAKDYLVYFAGAQQNTFIVPDGVVNLDMSTLKMIGCYNAFDDAIGKFQLAVPESVTTLLNEASFLGSWRISMIHCAPGSVVEKYAKDNDIDYDYDFSTQYEEVEESTPHGKVTYRVSEDHATLVRYEGTDRKLTVASSVQGKPVTTIGDGQNRIQELEYDFSEKDLPEDESQQLEAIEIPEGVTVISAHALELYLDELTLPDTLKVIGDHAISLSGAAELPKLADSVEYVGENFISSYSEKEFYIPSSLADVDAQAFTGLKEITAFVIGEGNPGFSVRDGILLDAEGTTLIAYPNGRVNEDGSVILPEGISTIGEFAFYGSWDMTSIEIPEGVTRINESAFASCSNLTSVKLPDGLASIGDSAFRFCSKLTDINLPNGLKSIGEYAFYSCDALESISFPDSLIHLGDDSFGECLNLHIDGLPESLAVIGNDAFGTYNDLEEKKSSFSLHLGPNLRSIGSGAFKYLRVTSFDIDRANPYYSVKDGFLTDLSETVIIMCPSGMDGTVTIPSTITRIADDAFEEVNMMTDLIVPDSVTHISNNAFSYSYVTETVENEDGTTQESRGARYNFTIHCSEGSYAEKYAIDNNIPYVVE